MDMPLLRLQSKKTRENAGPAGSALSNPGQPHPRKQPGEEDLVNMDVRVWVREARRVDCVWDFLRDKTCATHFQTKAKKHDQNLKRQDGRKS